MPTTAATSGTSAPPKYFVTGQFSRFVRPGDRVVHTEAGSHDVLVSAYLGERGFVILVINDSDVAPRLSLTIKGRLLVIDLAGVRTT